MLLARLFPSLPLTCPSCGADMRIVAFITEAAPARRMRAHIAASTQPPQGMRGTALSWGDDSETLTIAGGAHPGRAFE
jgi:hypothetical protein